MAEHSPALRPFDGAGIPQVLKDQKRWAPWRAVWNKKKHKFDKIPMRADRPEYGLSTAKPDQWFSYDTALTAFRKHPQMLAGVGYVMTGAHGVVGVDLDHCVTDGGEIAPWAAEVIAKLDSYTEISPSGTGLRVLSSGDHPTDWVNHDVGIEIYGGNEARFLTVTGEHLPGSPVDVRAPRDGVLRALETRYAKERRKADVIDLNMPELVDDLLLPGVADLDVPHQVRDFLAEGLHSGDRSRAVFAAAVALYNAGLADDEAFTILATNEHVMEIALDHRRQDHDRALLYVWREHCCKGKARAAELRTLSTDDFDVLAVEAPGAGNLAPVKEARFKVQRADEFLQRRPASWIIKGVLPRAGLALLVGASGSGKTFLTLDLVGSIAQGGEWRGRKVAKGRVAYICAEGAGGFRNRVEAYTEHYGIDRATFDVGVIPDAPNFLIAEDIKDVVAALRAFGKLDVVVVDTYAQVMPGGDENGGVDGGKVIKHCQLIHKLTGAIVLLVHHVGKDSARGARGWSGLRAAADVEITVERAQDHRAATVTKMKDGEEGAEFGFKLNTVTIGEDEDGEDITSCVLEHTTAVPKADRKKEPTGTVEKLVLRVVMDMADLDGGDTPAKVLIEACVNQMILDPGKRDRRREMAARALEKLRESGRLVFTNGTVRLV